MLANCLANELKENYGVVNKGDYYEIITKKEADLKGISLVYVTNI